MQEILLAYKQVLSEAEYQELKERAVRSAFRVWAWEQKPSMNCFKVIDLGKRFCRAERELENATGQKRARIIASGSCRSIP